MKYKEVKKRGSFTSISHEGFTPAFKVVEDYDNEGNCLGNPHPASCYNGGKFDPSAVDACPFVDMEDPVSAASVASIENNISGTVSTNPMAAYDMCKELAANL